ncbi:MAG: serpin family protein [Saprospiraceae bacterium]|nr:serpin family protein [Saprospiraceae bacterium]
MKIRFQLLLIALAILCSQCKKENKQPPKELVDFSCTDQPTACELTAANGNFALDVFKQINSEEPSDKNIFISPFSMSTALTMTTNGAANQTLDDMRNTLKINGMQMQSVNESYKTLLAVLPNLDANTQLNIANSIWSQEGYPVLPSFLEINSNYFGSEVIPVDFRDPEPVITKVNGWVKDKTNGLIEKALTDLPPDMVMLLINAIYFNGTWKTEFDAKDTKKADFQAPSGTAQVDMMHIKGSDFSYFENELFQAIDLPYGDSIFSMSVFLPNEGNDVEDVIAAMTSSNWAQWLSAFNPHVVQLYLPKFKLEYDIKMKRTLSTMGMSVAFSDFADFSNLVEGEELKIGEVIHKAVVDVSEKGTEAAAVTIVEVVDTSVGGSSSPVVFNANRPFVFVIRDNKTNSILFMGKVMNPND